MTETNSPNRPLVLVAAGGTGGHLFPAEALAAALDKRGIAVDLATDERAEKYGGKFPAQALHVIPSATLRGKNPLSLARTGVLLSLGALKAYALIGRIRPKAVVGFGGYPTVPPLIAASWRGVPTIIHEQNGVMGRANRLLAKRVTTIAVGFKGIAGIDPALAGRAIVTGNPLRPEVVTAAAVLYDPPQKNGPIRLLVFGGSQGAQVMSEVVPAAIEKLEPGLRARLSIVEQAREEDIAQVREAYFRLGVQAETATFFADLPARIAQSHLIISRAGATTVAELAAIGRPAILVPLPHALDQDQLANASMLEKAGGAILMQQTVFTPERLAAEIGGLAAAPERLAQMAKNAHAAGTLDGAERLAELVIKVAGI